MSEEKRYEVGFHKPPKSTQFKKGQSGNPSGRRKGSKSVKSVLANASRERVIVVENGDRRSILKLEAALKRLVNKSASGDEKFLRQLLNLLALVEEPTPQEDIFALDRPKDSTLTINTDLFLAARGLDFGGENDHSIS